MPNREHKPVGTFDSFEELFQRAEERIGYWVELGKLEFTEEMIARMKECGIKKGQLANALGAKPAFVTRLVSGHNNFTLETMVRVGRALDCEFRCHLQPAGTKACWIDVLKQEPHHHVAHWAPEEFQKPATISPDFANEQVPLAA